MVPEDRHALACVTGMSVAENMMLDRLHRFRRFGLLDRAALRSEGAGADGAFRRSRRQPRRGFRWPSPVANQQKAVLARELTLDSLRFLLAAQPTRGLDVGAVEAIYNHIRAVAARGVGVLLISSELDELLSVAHRVVVLYRGRVMGICRADRSERERIGAWMAGQQEQMA